MAAAEGATHQDLALTEVCETCGAKFASKQRLGAHKFQKHGYRNPDRKRASADAEQMQVMEKSPREWGEKVEEKEPRKRGRPPKPVNGPLPSNEAVIEVNIMSSDLVAAALRIERAKLELANAQEAMKSLVENY